MGLTILCIVGALVFSRDLFACAEFLLERGRKFSVKRAKAVKAVRELKKWKGSSNNSSVTAWIKFWQSGRSKKSPPGQDLERANRT